MSKELTCWKKHLMRKAQFPWQNLKRRNHLNMRRLKIHDEQWCKGGNPLCDKGRQFKDIEPWTKVLNYVLFDRWDFKHWSMTKTEKVSCLIYEFVRRRKVCQMYIQGKVVWLWIPHVCWYLFSIFDFFRTCNKQINSSEHSEYIFLFFSIVCLMCITFISFIPPTVRRTVI